MIKYIGSKRVLIPHIVSALSAFAGAKSVLDLFSGTSRVGHALKRNGYFVIANDHLSYAATLGLCYVQADRKVWLEPAQSLLKELATIPAAAGYFTATFCEQARFFRPENGARIDAIREAIKARGLPAELEAIALVSLMEAADRVDSTTGVQMAYLKQWAPRAHNSLELRLPDFLPGPGQALHGDALDAAGSVDADVAYIDPPYNQHSYLGNYHVWESLVRWDKPEVYGIARKRIQCRDYSSPFNSKRKIREAFAAIVARLRARHLLVSFNNEGYLDRADLEEILQARGHVRVASIDFKRYVGAQIGIYNPSGEKVGRVSHLRNKEFLFVVSPERRIADRAIQALEMVQGARGELALAEPRH